MDSLGLARGRNGSIYMADHLNSQLMKLQQGSLLGTVVAGAGTPPNSITAMNRPVDVHGDAWNKICITDRNNHRVMLWRERTPASSISLLVSVSQKPLSIDSGIPAGVSVNSPGNIFVSDFSNHRVMRWFAHPTNGIVVAETRTPVNGRD